MVTSSIPLVMPKMSMTMTEGVFVAWHKSEGDEVRQGEVVAEVTTDKVDMEVEATVDGVLATLVAEPEQVIAVGDPIAYVMSEADDLLGGLFDEEPAPQPHQEPEPEPVPETPVVAERNGAPTRSVAAVPAARRVAAERGLDLSTITPTGPWNTIRLADLPERHVRPGQASSTPRGGRDAIARRMSASAQVPQFVLYREVDVEDADRQRGDASWTAVFTHVLAAALRRHPDLNATWTDGGPQRYDDVSVAVAVDTERGLLAPVIDEPDRMGLATLAERIRETTARARAGRLEIRELSATASSTMSNLGGSGIGGFQALLTPPQASALAVGAVERRVVPVPGGIGTRLRCTLGLSVDHRVADGVAGAQLLQTIDELLGGELV